MQTIRDLRFGIRAMARSPLLTIVAVAALGVGIGLNTTIFSLVNAVLFKGLPFEEAHELVHLDTRIIPTGQNAGVSYPELLDWRDQSTTFDGLAGFIPTSTNLSDERRFPENIRGTRVTTDLFSVVRQPTLMGRDFVPEDGEAGAEPVAIIGEGLWRSRYGADPEILGASIRGNGIPFTVVGIMPLGMEFPNNSQIWFALREGEEFEPRENRSLQVIGRLAGGTSIDEAGVEMSGIGARLATAYPETNQDRGVRLRTSSEFYNGGEIRVLFLALMGAVTFVLLIACANVANLLLAQALRRTGETSIRTALGASRWRIIRQLLTESLVLSIVGGGLGIGLAFAGVSLFDRAVASIDGKPYWIDFSIDLTVLGYLAAVAVGTTLLFGLAPALQASRVNINDTLKDGGRSNTGGAGSRRWAGLLIVGELSLTVVLLAGAGLMFRSLVNLERVDLGVDTRGVVTAQVQLPAAGYAEEEQRIQFQARLLERLRQVPGIESAALGSGAPGLGAFQTALAIPGQELADAEGENPSVASVGISPGYFETFRTGVLEGRTFESTDGDETFRVAIVNPAFVERYWPGESPMGRSLTLGAGDNAQTMQVVGVSPAILQAINQGPESREIPPTVYVPFRQRPTSFVTVMVRGPADTQTLISGLRNAVGDVDPDLPAANARTYEEWIAEATWTYRVFGGVFAIAALIALVLSAAGIFGVTSYAVDQRTPEIGMRMALGASSGNVLWLVTRGGAIQLVIGLIIGTLGALGVTRVLAGIMFGVGTSDPVTLIAVAIVLTVVTVSAWLVPARRAMRLDPIDAIRFD